MPQDAPSRAGEALLSRTSPPIPDIPSPPQSKRSLDSQHVNGYFVQHTNWFQDQLAGNLDSHISWPPMDCNLPLQQQGERCASTHSQNGELSKEGSTNGYLKVLDEAPIQASPESITSPRIWQYPHFQSVGTRRPALLTKSAPSSSAVRNQNRLDQALFASVILTTETGQRHGLPVSPV